MQINLTEMTQLAPIFRELFKGFHISRRDPELYSQLSNQQDAYRALFRSLGYELVCDTRGFYYFVPEQVGAQVNKTAQRLALFTFILVEHLADQGRDPLAVLDGGSIGRDELPPLLEKYRDLFLQAEVTTQEELEEKVMRRLTQLGFAAEDNGVYRFLPPIHRFLDVCLSVQQDRDLASNLHASEMQFTAPVLMEEDDEPVVILESYTADADDEEIVIISEPSETAVIEATTDSAVEDESEEDALARAIAEEQEAQA
ncbi:Mks condensin complex protein MksE [Pseudomonas nicosulfuronedens]